MLVAGENGVGDGVVKVGVIRGFMVSGVGVVVGDGVGLRIAVGVVVAVGADVGVSVGFLLVARSVKVLGLELE